PTFRLFFFAHLTATAPRKFQKFTSPRAASKSRNPEPRRTLRVYLRAAAHHEAGDERIDVEIVNDAIAIDIGDHLIASRKSSPICGRIGKRQHERVDVEIVDRAITIRVAMAKDNEAGGV